MHIKITELYLMSGSNGKQNIENNIKLLAYFQLVIVHRPITKTFIRTFKVSNIVNKNYVHSNRTYIEGQL